MRPRWNLRASPPHKSSNGSRAIRGAFLFLHRASCGLAAAAGAGVKVLGGVRINKP